MKLGIVSGALLLMTVGCAVNNPEDTAEARKASARDTLIASTRSSIASRGVTAIPDAPNVRAPLVALGRALAFDKILSGNRDVSCMTCHPAAFATGDGRFLSMGVTGTDVGPARTGHFAAGEEGRNAPPLFNLHAMKTLFWDGRVEVLPNGDFRTPAGLQLTQAMKSVMEFGPISVLPMFPVTARDEMRGFGTENELALIADGKFTQTWQALMERLGAIPEYRQMFEAAYPGTPFSAMTFAHASNAIGGFIVSSFEANDSPWDKFLRGNDAALDDQSLAGAEIFMRTCVNCHGGSTGSDEAFHNTLLSQFGPGPRSGGHGPSGIDDFGRERVTGLASDRYRFRTTPLRNVEFTAPYGHVGNIVDLQAFVAHYSENFDKKGDAIGAIPGPVQNLLEWDAAQINDGTLSRNLGVLDNFDEIIANRDPLFFAGSPIRPEFVAPLTAFMIANSDDGSITALGNVTPASVPSRLPVAD